MLALTGQVVVNGELCGCLQVSSVSPARHVSWLVVCVSELEIHFCTVSGEFDALQAVGLSAP